MTVWTRSWTVTHEADQRNADQRNRSAKDKIKKKKRIREKMMDDTGRPVYCVRLSERIEM
jgi:hypothetical protein